MANSSKLVSRSIRAERITQPTITRYFDGNLCLGTNLVKAAVHNYGYTKTQLALVCQTHVKSVRAWYNGEIEPRKASMIKILAAIEYMKDFRGPFKKVKIQVDEAPVVKHNAINPVNEAQCPVNALDPAS